MYLLNEDEIDRINSATIRSEIADFIAKDAQSYKKAQDAIAKLHNQRLNDRTEIAKNHPIMSSLRDGVRTGGRIFVSGFVLLLILSIFNGRIPPEIAKKCIKHLMNLSAQSAIVVAGINIPFNYLMKWLDKKSKNKDIKGENEMKNESLGLRLLSKLDRLSNGQHIYEVDELENDGTAEEAAEATSDETSEALKKLRGHLYRFQEKDDEYKGAGLGLHAAIGTGVGAVGGRQLARHSYMKNSGAGEAIKATKQGMKDSVKNLKHFAHKANTAKAQSKVAKITGNIAKAQQLQRTADASARAAQKAKTMVNAGKKTISGLKGAANAAGRAGLVKGGLIGGLALGGAYGLQQLHKRFKEK